MNIVLMAGGGGTRLWPLSRRSRPKQFLDFGSGKTLLEQAYDRARILTEPEHIYLATAAEYADKVQELLPELNGDHIFLEPERRDTTAAFVAVAQRLAHRGQADEPVLFMWTDHIFTHETEFLGDLRKVEKLLAENPQATILLGHTPISPETVFGYVEMGEQIVSYSDTHRVKKFHEKPDAETAEKYVAAGNYYWNLGYFSLLPSYLLSEVRRLAPETVTAMDAFGQALAANDNEALNEAYGQFPKISIEYTFIEKTPNIIAITGDYGWSDVGNWAAVQQIFGKQGDHKAQGHHVHVDSQDNYVYNTTDKCVSLIGIKDTIVVVTDDAVLVTNKKDAAKVKDVVKKLEEEDTQSLL